MSEPIQLTPGEREQVATILSRRANEIAWYSGEHDERACLSTNKKPMPASVEYALELEMKRLRKLADKINPPKKELDEE